MTDRKRRLSRSNQASDKRRKIVQPYRGNSFFWKLAPENAGGIDLKHLFFLDGVAYNRVRLCQWIEQFRDSSSMPTIPAAESAIPAESLRTLGYPLDFFKAHRMRSREEEKNFDERSTNTSAQKTVSLRTKHACTLETQRQFFLLRAVEAGAVHVVVGMLQKYATTSDLLCDDWALVHAAASVYDRAPTMLDTVLQELEHFYNLHEDCADQWKKLFCTTDHYVHQQVPCILWKHYWRTHPNYDSTLPMATIVSGKLPPRVQDDIMSQSDWRGVLMSVTKQCLLAGDNNFEPFLHFYNGAMTQASRCAAVGFEDNLRLLLSNRDSWAVSDDDLLEMAVFQVFQSAFGKPAECYGPMMPLAPSTTERLVHFAARHHSLRIFDAVFAWHGHSIAPFVTSLDAISFSSVFHDFPPIIDRLARVESGDPVLCLKTLLAILQLASEYHSDAVANRFAPEVVKILSESAVDAPEVVDVAYEQLVVNAVENRHELLFALLVGPAIRSVSLESKKKILQTIVDRGSLSTLRAFVELGCLVVLENK